MLLRLSNAISIFANCKMVVSPYVPVDGIETRPSDGEPCVINAA